MTAEYSMGPNPDYVNIGCKSVNTPSITFNRIRNKDLNQITDDEHLHTVEHMVRRGNKCLEFGDEKGYTEIVERAQCYIPKHKLPLKLIINESRELSLKELE